MTEVPGLVEILTMLAGGIGVGAVVSFLLEKTGLFQRLSSTAKWWVVLGLNLGLPLVAVLALQLVPPHVWVALEPYWKALAMGFLGWAGSQVVHKVFNQRSGAYTLGR